MTISRFQHYLLISLRARPALWVTAAIVAGVVLGPVWGAVAVGREGAPDVVRKLGVWWPLLPAVALDLAAYIYRHREWQRRVSIALALMCCFAAYTAWRLLPPPNDISRLVCLPPPAGPQQPLGLTLRGVVAASPERGEFGQQFPFEVERIQASSAHSLQGRVWVRAPLSVRVGVGDELEARGELTDLPRVGNPGERDATRRWIIERCWCLFRVKRGQQGSSMAVLRRGVAYPLLRSVEGWRARLLNHYEDAFTRTGQPYPNATAQLLCAMVFGEGGLRDPLPPPVNEEFRAAGLSHLLVASGQQVAMLVIIVLGVARIFGLRRIGLLLALLPALAAYTLLVGGSASIWRATIAGLVVALALIVGREIDPLSLWCWALAAILAYDPAQAWSLSLQLTFAATWGLLCLAPLLRRSLWRLANGSEASPGAVGAVPGTLDPPGRGFVLEVVSLSLGAQLATLPILLFQFGQLSMTGLGANFLAVPLAGVLVGTGVFGLFLPFARLNFALANTMRVIVHWAASGPGSHIETPPFSLPRALLLTAFLTGLAVLPGFWDDLRAAVRYAWRQRYKRWAASGGAPASLVRRGLLISVVAIALWLGYDTAATSWHGQQVRFTMLDVGQGESLVVRSPSGRTVLIDGGTLNAGERSDIGRSVIVPYLQSMGVTRLDAVVLTHDDSDHLTGLPAVLRELPVGMILDGAARDGALPSPDYQAVLDAAQRWNIGRVRAQSGQTLDLGEGASLRVLWPPPGLHSDTDNEQGIVLRLDYGATSALLTADTGAPTEAALERNGAPLNCIILKVGHHGSAGSTTDEFLNKVQPRVAVISCGRYNPFGHPTAQVLQRLVQHGVQTYRTDRDGAIEVSCDRSNCWVQTYH